MYDSKRLWVSETYLFKFTALRSEKILGRMGLELLRVTSQEDIYTQVSVPPPHINLVRAVAGTLCWGGLPTCAPSLQGLRGTVFLCSVPPSVMGMQLCSAVHRVCPDIFIPQRSFDLVPSLSIHAQPISLKLSLPFVNMGGVQT